VTARIRVKAEFLVQDLVPIVVAGATRIYDEDVSGVDEQGVPIARRGLLPFATDTASAMAIGVTFPGLPYPTWYVAFVDLNGNGSLDTGEPFGVDPRNPLDTGCDAHTTTIEIDALRASTTR